MNRFVLRAAGLFLFAASAIAMAAPQLVVPVTPSGPLAARSSPVPGALPVRFNAEGLSAVQPGMEVELTLPDGSRHTYVYERSVSHGGGFNTWIARSAFEGDSARAIVTHGPAGSFGWMATGFGEYYLRPSGDGHDLLARRTAVNIAPAAGGSDAVVAPPDDLAIAPWKGISTAVNGQAGGKSFGLPKATPDDARQADVMILYTRDIANKLGAGLLPMIYNLIASANQAYADSEIALSLRLVNATMIDFPNTNGSSAALSGMANSGIHAASFTGLTHPVGASLRDTVGADYVALVRDGPDDTGGIGYLLKNPTLYPVVQVPSTNAYSVNNYCAQGCEGIFAHELGHNMGNTHDRATVARDSGTGTVNPNGPVFPYSFGHNSCLNGYTCNPFVAGGCTGGYATCLSQNANDFGTIMSYVPPRVMKFSNPDVLCVPPGGSAPGRACGSAPATPAPEGESNNAKSMNNIRQNISAYRNQTIASLPGSLQFTNAAFTGSEAGGTLAFTVSRASGSSGAVSVSYTVTAGTATSGIDYTVANGTLHWADGDASNKTITATLANDMAAEGIEAFSATLSAPSGATGVYLGYPFEATGLILETWPVGTVGALPAGFTNPAGSSATWAIANDTSNDADGTSLKSGALDFSTKLCNNAPPYTIYNPIPCPSITEFSGTFAAGTIAFAYRVSGFPGFGFLEFLVDGAVVQQATGSDSNAAADTGWQFFSTPIAAGAHTLQWRYRTMFGFPCGNASDGESILFPGCLDRAWIDQVSLPIGVAASTTSLLSSLNPATSGQPVTFTATVSGSSGTPTGTVAFRDGTSAISGCAAVVVAAGSAGCTTSFLLTGVHAITAVYSGSPTYGPSASTALNETVNPGVQLLTANPASLDFGGQSISTTAPAQSVTVTNASGGPVTVTAIIPPTGYSVVTHDCATLAAAATCEVTLAFTPTLEGPATGAVAITYAGGGPTVISVAGIGERSLITHYYRSILRRAPDGGGKAFWESEATRMSGLGANVNETWYSMASFFFFSPEYIAFGRDDVGFVTDLYNTFFNRPPDGGGLAFWTGQLSTGTPREVVLVSFMLSTEFVTFAQGIFGNTAARAEVDVVMDFFRGLLSRLPETAGFNFWVGQFRTAQCAGGGAAGAVYTQVESISSAFATGGEYLGRARTNAQYVGDLYNAFLRRGGDQAGVLFWIDQLDTGAMTRNFVRQQFIASPEFTGRVNAVISQGCLT